MDLRALADLPFEGATAPAAPATQGAMISTSPKTQNHADPPHRIGFYLKGNRFVIGNR